MVHLLVIMADDTLVSIMPFFSVTNYDVDNILFPSNFSKFVRNQNSSFHQNLKNVANS